MSNYLNHTRDSRYYRLYILMNIDDNLLVVSLTYLHTP